MTAIVCSRCQSDSVRLASLLHAEGKTSGRSTGISPIWANGKMAFMFTSTGTTSQTDLSRQCEPPHETDFEDQAELEVGTPPPANGCGAMLLAMVYWPVAVIFCGLVVAGQKNKTNATGGECLVMFLVGMALAYAIWWAWMKYHITPKRDSHNAGDLLVRQRTGELYAKALADYNRSFVCMKCGHVTVH